MPDEAVDTVQLHGWVARMRAGDSTAGDELFLTVCNRLERLARKMLRRFPDVRRWAETGDVLQNSLLRLLRALQTVQPNSVRDFFGLAAEQMRRELLDLARRYRGAQGKFVRELVATGENSAPPEAADRTEGAADLEKWEAFHVGVEQLPVEERETVGLIYYHGWTQQAVAELFGVSVRTVQRRWESALVKLRDAV